MSAITSLLSEGQNIAFAHDSLSTGTECEVRTQGLGQILLILEHIVLCLGINLSSVVSPQMYTQQIEHI
jgi:hypothetical protein